MEEYLLWVSCLLGACVKYSCFSICLLVFYLSFFFPFDVPSVKESFYGTSNNLPFFQIFIKSILSTEGSYTILLFIPCSKYIFSSLGRTLHCTFLDLFYALVLNYFVWFYIFKLNFTNHLMIRFHSGKSPDFDFRYFALANNLLFDRCCSPMGSGKEIKYILVLTLPKLESKGERPVY